jgi:four helix bundle protein
MATFKNFTDIDAWQRARALTNAIYVVSKNGSFSKHFGLRDQMRRASVSIMANIAEGFGRSGSAEFQQYLAIAKGSTCEVVSHLYVALDQGYITRREFAENTRLAEETANLIGGLMKYIRQSSVRGVKYVPAERK